MDKLQFPSKYLSNLSKKAKRQRYPGWQKEFAQVVKQRYQKKAKSVI